MRAIHRCAILSLFMGATALPTVARIVEVPPEASVEVTGPRVKNEKCTWGPHQGHDMTTQSTTISTGKTTYGLLWTACIDKAHGDRAGWIEGYLGMPQPNSANWYHGGFLFINVNGEDLGTYRPVYFGPSESGKRGAVDVVWSPPSGLVRARFLALPDDDALLMEMRLEPKQPITSLTLHLSCYPGEFTSWNKIKGDRTINTSTKEEHQNKWAPDEEKAPAPRTVTLDPARDSWGFYSDGVCDVARGLGGGPCAMMFLPEQITGESVTLTDYPVLTDLTANPATKSLRMVFWDFAGQTNNQALKSMRENVERYRQLLARFDFTTTTVTDLLEGKTESELAGLVRRAPSLNDDRATVGAYQEKLNEAIARARATRKATGEVPIQEENEVLELLRQEESIVEPLRWRLLFED